MSMRETSVVIPFWNAGIQTAGVKTLNTTGNANQFLVPVGLKVVRTLARIGTAPTGSAFIIDFQLTRLADGAVLPNIYTTAANRPTIAIGATTSAPTISVTTGTNPQNVVAPYTAITFSTSTTLTGPGGPFVPLPFIPAPDNAILEPGDLLNLNVVQIGSGTAGSDIYAVLHCIRY